MHKKKIEGMVNGHTVGTVMLLPIFWSFLLLIIFKYLFPLFSTTIGIGPFYGIISMMVLFAFLAPFVHNFFYQVNYTKMAILWVIFTAIGVLRLENGPDAQSQKHLVLHLLSWQLPAIVFSLIYTLLYSKKLRSSFKLDLPGTNAF